MEFVIWNFEQRMMKKKTKLRIPPSDGRKKKKAEFLGMASHQLRTPLTTINWYVEMLRSGDAGKLNAEQRRYLQEVDTGVRHMVKLINGLLEITEAERGCVTICAPNFKQTASARKTGRRTGRRASAAKRL
jgi:signal transduction histidine kinase